MLANFVSNLVCQICCSKKLPVLLLSQFLVLMLCRYDRVFGPETRQEDVYRAVEDCAKRVMDGER
jgi:hypothetical protein